MTQKEKNHKEREEEFLDLESIPSPEAEASLKKADAADHKKNEEESQEAADQTETLENQVEAEIVDLNSRLQSLNDKYLRLMAEFDNFKRRTAREYERMVESAGEKLILEIIEVRENFERALATGETLPPESQSFVAGMKLIFDKLENILARQGLQVFCENGEEFNPELHDALLKQPHDKIKPEHVAMVCEKGYKLKGRVIKHAKVIVSSGAHESDTETGETSVEDSESK